ncbi:MAG: hypothetical protein COX06_02665, partial [Candidatus Zambryskibacteria bacterium CG22_combo_CG10-13_8_21_14_all_42_17]
MSYHIYTTKGVILGERSIREADRVYSILTRDFGLLKVTAMGVRKESSKLRGSLEPFSLSNISLVRGKEYWRITSAVVIKNISASSAIARPLVLVLRLVQGEAPNPELFDAVEEAILSGEHHDDMFEVNIVSKIIFHLGYLKESDMFLEKKPLIKAINEGIQASY